MRYVTGARRSEEKRGEGEGRGARGGGIGKMKGRQGRETFFFFGSCSDSASVEDGVGVEAAVSKEGGGDEQEGREEEGEGEKRKGEGVKRKGEGDDVNN